MKFASLLSIVLLSSSLVAQQAGTASDLPMHVSGSVKPPVVIRSGELEKPPGSTQRWYAQVYLWVEEDGTPSHIHDVRSTGKRFDAAAVQAVSQYRFKPATLNKKPVRVDLYIEINVHGF